MKSKTIMNTKDIKKTLKTEELSQNGMTIVEYVWIGGKGCDLRAKCKTVKGEITDISQIKEWNYDGSSTCQAETESSEVLIRPVALFNDPFRGAPNKIVLCDTYHLDGSPTNTNFRFHAKNIFDKGEKEHDPWFGIEQEYVMMESMGSTMSWPVGWPKGNFPNTQGQYYCGTGSLNSFGREIMNAHLKACLYAGVQIFGTNAEVMPGQWEFQIGNCKSIDIGDHMWMARYLLERIGEYHNVNISYSPKPIKGDWNGSGCHTNCSFNSTRKEGGLVVIQQHLKKLEEKHLTSISLYGEDNMARLTGKHETCDIKKFVSGVGNRAASIRVPRTTFNDKCGYYEDRRPAANMDPYVVASSIFSIACLDNYGLDPLVKHYKSHMEQLKQSGGSVSSLTS